MMIFLGETDLGLMMVLYKLKCPVFTVKVNIAPKVPNVSECMDYNL